jgi:xanthine dehydrogenase accessory factor
VVIKEALKALADGQPRLIRISPSSSPEEGIVDYAMTCHSGGALDIFIEPVLPKPHILILGRSPVAASLTKLAKVVNYTVSLAAAGADRDNFPDPDLLQTDLELNHLKITPQTFIVVSTQGECDEEALEKALGSSAAYVAFVASKTKAGKMLEYLRDRGVSAARLSQVRTPAGLDIRAASPEEIAVSILAEIIQVKGTKALTSKLKAEFPVPTQQVKDPICGMSLEASAAKYKSEFHGNVFYFCCAGCKDEFEKHPDKYALATAR